MTFIEILHDYGWAGVILILVTERVFPFVAKSVFPQFQKKQQADIEMARKEQEHGFEMETRQVEAVENLATTCQSIERFMVSVDARLTRLEAKLDSKPLPRKKKTPRS